MSSLGSATAHLTSCLLHQSSPCPWFLHSGIWGDASTPACPRFALTYDCWQTSRRWRSPLKNSRLVSVGGYRRGAERLTGLCSQLIHPAYVGCHCPLASCCLCFLSFYVGRLQCDAIQAEPHALGAVLQPCPSPHDPCRGPAADSVCAVV